MIIVHLKKDPISFGIGRVCQICGSESVFLSGTDHVWVNDRKQLRMKLLEHEGSLSCEDDLAKIYLVQNQ